MGKVTALKKVKALVPPMMSSVSMAICSQFMILNPSWEKVVVVLKYDIELYFTVFVGLAFSIILLSTLSEKEIKKDKIRPQSEGEMEGFVGRMIVSVLPYFFILISLLLIKNEGNLSFVQMYVFTFLNWLNPIILSVMLGFTACSYCR